MIFHILKSQLYIINTQMTTILIYPKAILIIKQWALEKLSKKEDDLIKLIKDYLDNDCEMKENYKKELTSSTNIMIKITLKEFMTGFMKINYIKAYYDN